MHCPNCGGEHATLERCPGVRALAAELGDGAPARDGGPARAPILLVDALDDERSCPACGRPTPAIFRFCGACGARLAPAAAGDDRFRLAVLGPGGETLRTVPLAAELLAGRGEGDLVLDDPFVSPRHARFRLEGAGPVIEDLDSLNGVFVRIRTEAEVVPGDTLRLGRQLLRLEPVANLRREAPDGTRTWGAPDRDYRARLIQLLETGVLGAVFPLRAGENRIGRYAGDATFPDDPTVAEPHARLDVDGRRARVVELSGAVWRKVSGPEPLAPGDVVLLGEQAVRLELC